MTTHSHDDATNTAPSTLPSNSDDDSKPKRKVDTSIDTNTGIIAWFARNSIAANLLMFFILIGGGLTALTINKQMFPQLEIFDIAIR